jgi:MoaD family protein
MMNVTLSYLLGLGDSIGRTREQVTLAQGTTLRELLEEVFGRYGPEFRHQVLDEATGQVHSHILILVNGIAPSRLARGLDTPLSAGDVVVFTRPMSGG